MAWSLPEAYTLLKKHDRELVKFYPYAGNDSFYIECWMIIKSFNTKLIKDYEFNWNIKLYSKNIADSLTVELDNVNKLQFTNGEEFYLSEYTVIPNFNELYSNLEQETELDNQVQKSALRYQNFDFDVLGLGEIVSKYTEGLSLTLSTLFAPNPASDDEISLTL